MFYSCLCDVGDFLVDSTLAVKFKDRFLVIFQVYGISTLCPSSFTSYASFTRSSKVVQLMLTSSVTSNCHYFSLFSSAETQTSEKLTPASFSQNIANKVTNFFQ